MQGGIKHINDYIHQFDIDSFNLSETEDGMLLSASRLYAHQLECSRYQIDYQWLMKGCSQQGAERLL